MKKISTYLSISLMLATLIIGIGIGYYLTPEYTLTMYDKNTMNLGQADRLLDLRYLNTMIAHHRGAVLMAEQAVKSERSDISSLAQEILKNEPVLIAELYQWKKDWYKDKRIVKDPLTVRLGSYDDKFDLRFLNALIAHHEVGIEMTKEVKTKSSKKEVLDNADAVETFLSASKKMLLEWRKNWYAL